MAARTREDYISASLGAKLRERVQKDERHVERSEPSRIFNLLICSDPTKNKRYAYWLVKAYINGSELEDLISRGNDALVKFDKLKSKKLLSPGQTDIGRLKDLHQLEDLVDSIALPEKELINRGRYEEWLNNDEVRVILPLDAVAAHYYGQGTRWCTASKETVFLSYFHEGYLIILIPKHPQYSGEKYQIHYPSNQRMDEKDRRAKGGDLRRRFPSIDFDKMYTETKESYQTMLLDGLASQTIPCSRVFKYSLNVLRRRWPEAEPYIMKDPEFACRYAYDVLEKRWPEAEPYIMKNPKWALSYATGVIGACEFPDVLEHD